MQQVFQMTVPIGGKWSGIIGRGNTIRFTAYEAGANLAMLLYNATDKTERYNMSDTLKAQHTLKLTQGHVLMSDNGRAMASIIEDTVGWHDTIGGVSTRNGTDAKYGITRYQDLRNAWLRNGTDNFAIELVRHGLASRDMTSPINIFSRVSADLDGHMEYQPCAIAPASISLRVEMDVLIVISNTPHPLDPRTTYPAVPIAVRIEKSLPIDRAIDVCVNACPEAKRAYENTWDYYALR